MFNQTKSIEVLSEIEEFIKNQNDEILHALKIIYPRVSTYEHWPDDGGFKFIFGDAEIFVPYASLTFFAQGLLHGERLLTTNQDNVIKELSAELCDKERVLSSLSLKCSELSNIIGSLSLSNAKG